MSHRPWTNWPLFFTISLYFLTIGVMIVLCKQAYSDWFVYILDDTYIHLSIAKNLAHHGVWGVCSDHFRPASSSLLWTLLLTLHFKLFGQSEVYPLVLNLIFSTLSLLSCYAILKRENVLPRFQCLILLAFLFFVPLPLLTLSGMEHTLHLLLMLNFVYLAAIKVSRDVVFSEKKDSALLILLALLLTSARYEGLFVSFFTCCFLLLRRRISLSLAVGFAALLPVITFGIWSLSQGGFFLPNSVLVKGRMISVHSLRDLWHYLSPIFIPSSKILPVWVCLWSSIVLFFLRIKQVGLFEKRQMLLLLFILSAIPHALFAKIGTFFRYEAYLLGAGLTVICLNLTSLIPEEWKFDALKIKLVQRRQYIQASLIFLLLIPVVPRGGKSLARSIRASENIAKQQIMMGYFVHKYYQGESLVAGDIGAINYYADIYCLDIIGLGSTEIARLKQEKRYNSASLGEYAKKEKARIAIVYDKTFRQMNENPPSDWILVGKWKIPNNVVCGEDTVSFYSLNPKETALLQEHLRDFSSFLPKDVEQIGIN